MKTLSNSSFTVLFFLTIIVATSFGSSSAGDHKSSTDVEDTRNINRVTADTPLANIGDFPSRLLDLCEGDCDIDADCVGSLLCYQRNTYDEGPPGCSGTPYSFYDYCYDPEITSMPTPSPTETGINLALMGTASHSSQYYGKHGDEFYWGPEKAINGILSDSTHTEREEDGWWRVDLAECATISSIIVWNRACKIPDCNNRLSNSLVQILDESDNVLAERALPDDTSSTSKLDYPFDFGPDGVSGGYAVKILKQPNSASVAVLSIAEVKVFGEAGCSSPPSSAPSSFFKSGKFQIKPFSDTSLCVQLKDSDMDGTSFKLKSCNEANLKQLFELHSLHGQINVLSNPTLCVTRVGTSRLTLDTCSDMMNEDQKWVYDRLASSDLMLREKGFRVLSTKDEVDPEFGTTLRVLEKNYDLTNGAQDWLLTFV